MKRKQVFLCVNGAETAQDDGDPAVDIIAAPPTGWRIEFVSKDEFGRLYLRFVKPEGNGRMWLRDEARMRQAEAEIAAWLADLWRLVMPIEE